MKWLVFAVGAAAAVTAYRAHSQDAELISASDGAAAELTVMDRVKWGMGSAGSFAVGGLVRAMTEKSELTLKQLGPSLKKKEGPDGRRAREAAANAKKLDQQALQLLAEASPIKAVNTAMRAKDYLDIAKRFVANP